MFSASQVLAPLTIFLANHVTGADRRRLAHPNLIQCHGTCDNFEPPSLIGLVMSLCMEGNIMEYLVNNPSADKLLLVGPPFST